MNRSLLAAAIGILLLSASAGVVTASTGWAPIDSADVRPGVSIVSGICTANFVFSNPDNTTFYIGTAAHCVDGKSYGDDICIAFCAGEGTLVYSSFKEIRDGATGLCSSTSANDFALVRIDDADEDKIHPAMEHYGGPTSIDLPSQGPPTGQKALTYGNSNLRFGLGNNREGVVGLSGPCETQIYTVTPGVFGDSGSPVILGNGTALGTLVTIEFVAPGANGVVNLEPAVAFAESNTALELELKTYQVLDDGLTP